MNDTTQQPPAAPMRKVLIAEDDVDTGLIYQELFSSVGAEVMLVTSGAACVDLALGMKAANKRFDLVVLDIRMPNMTGDEVARRLREGGIDSPIVAFTAGASMMGKKKSEQNGIQAYFSKSTLNRKLIQALLDQYCP